MQDAHQQVRGKVLVTFSRCMITIGLFVVFREFKIQCKGVGVLTPLNLSHQVIHFPATAVYDESVAYIHIHNNHLDTNEFKHPVPRIGSGEVAAVGPTSYEFIVPPDAPFTVAPSVGTLDPGSKQRLQLRFAPK